MFDTYMSGRTPLRRRGPARFSVALSLFGGCLTLDSKSPSNLSTSSLPTALIAKRVADHRRARSDSWWPRNAGLRRPGWHPRTKGPYRLRGGGSADRWLRRGLGPAGDHPGLGPAGDHHSRQPPERTIRGRLGGAPERGLLTELEMV